MKQHPITRTLDERGYEIMLVPLGREGKHQAKLYSDDYDRLLALGVSGKWCVVDNGDGRIYASARSKINGRHIIIARLLMNPLPGHSVYYRNGDSLDLRRDNLEIRKNHGIYRDAEHFILTRKDVKAIEERTAA